MKKKTKMIVTISLGIFLGGLAAFFWYYQTQTAWVASENYERASSAHAKTLVVVYSRTGNTMAAAKTVARHFDADLLAIEAPEYSRDLKGLQLASEHAGDEVTTTPIVHDAVELSQYDLIFLFSPTWWFRPAVPMFSFVENHDFLGKPVCLVMTGNSRKTEEKTAKFGQLVERKNGKLLDVLFIKRGRIYWQKTPEEVNREVIQAIQQRKAIWSEYVDVGNM